MGVPATHAVDNHFLSEIISTVSSSLELDQVLGSVVALLSEASAVHACFVYLVDEEARRLELRAASEPYTHLTGKVALERGEGLAWWALERREPAFIPENAPADPRFKDVPALEEQRFQSLLSVPILARDGAEIGVITVHTEAPREFSTGEVDFLASSASLVAGAIENARLYSATRRRLSDLEHLTALGETAARAETLEELLPAVAARAREALGAHACRLYLLDQAGEELTLRCSVPSGRAGRAPDTIGISDLGAELGRNARGGGVAVPLLTGDELLGLLSADGTGAVALARAAANVAAVAVKKVQLIERLMERSLIKDFFELLAHRRRHGDVHLRADRLGCDLDRPHLVLAAMPPDDRLEQMLSTVTPRSLIDRQDDLLRALLRVPAAGERRLVDDVRRIHGELDQQVAIGLSSPCRGVSSYPAAFEEARYALLGSTVLQGRATVMTYEDLGAYRYLLRMSIDDAMREPYRDAILRLVDYDAKRQTALLKTLEEYLRRRGNISATSEALYVHPNTLRQRLRRITDLTGIDLASDDWLLVELALRLVTLQRALHADVHIPEVTYM